jgi:4-hydroxythreonine-4-phosphate dehydrogenase
MAKLADHPIDARLLVIGSPPLLAKAAAGLPGVTVTRIVSPDDADGRPGGIPVLDPGGPDVSGAIPGRPSRDDGLAALGFLRRAAELAIGGRIEAIVTAPVNKKAISDAGVPFQGHTEYLAEAAGTADFAMMLVSESLRVVPVTRHITLARVPAELTESGVLSTIRIVNDGLRHLFAIPSPRIGVTALNPHGGEGGLFGGEEGDVIAPAVEAARSGGIDVSGPYPADTLFVRARKGAFDAVIAMYHDQAMIPIKLLSFGGGVNVTLGLPFVRTSVDHGTAYDIAGRGVADPGSMIAAISLAASMARARRRG